MSNDFISPYYLSIWDIHSAVIDNIETFEEYKICDIGTIFDNSPIRAIDPQLKLDINGQHKFSFSMYYNYYDTYENEYVDNPLKELLIVQRRLKLKYQDEWYDFIIDSIDTESSNKKFTVNAVEAFSKELGKTGYTIELDTELENNMGTAEQLGVKTLDGSDWSIVDSNGYIANTTTKPEGFTALKSDLIQEIQEDMLYKIYLKSAVQFQQVDDSTNIVTFGPADILYAFSTNIVNQTDRLQVIAPIYDSSYTSEEAYEETLKGSVIEAINYETVDAVTYSGFMPTIVDTYKLLINIKGYRLVKTQLSAYDSLVEQYVTFYEKRNNLTPEEQEEFADRPYHTSAGTADTIRRYTVYDYEQPHYTTNVTSNPNTFTSTNGWEYAYTNGTQPTLKIANSGTATSVNYKSYLNLVFPATTYYYLNTGPQTATAVFSDGITKGKKFVFKFKAHNKVDEQEIIGNQINTLRALVGIYVKDGNEYLPVTTIFNHSSTPKYAKEYQILSDEEKEEYTYWFIHKTEVSKPFDVYTYDYGTGLYTLYEPSATPCFSDNVTYYQLSGGYYYIVASANDTYTYNDLFGQTTNNHYFGFFLYHNDQSAIHDIYIEDCQWFEYISKGDSAGTPYLPEESQNATTRLIYNYYITPESGLADDIKYYTSEQEDPLLQKKYDDKCRRIRSISEKESNRYNILQKICEQFECWLQLNVARDSDTGKILTKKDAIYVQLVTSDIGAINKEIEQGETIPTYYTLNDGTYTEFNGNTENYLLLSSDERTTVNASSTPITVYYRSNNTWVSSTFDSSYPLKVGVNYYWYRKGLGYGSAFYSATIVWKQDKYVTFHRFTGQEQWAGFKYGVNLKNVKRTTDASSVVTKLIVNSNENEYATNGYCAIANAEDNPSGEDTIYDFAYFINHNQDIAETIQTDLSNLNIELKKLNTQITAKANTILEVSNNLDNVTAQNDTYSARYSSNLTEYQRLAKLVKDLTTLTPDQYIASGMYIASADAYAKSAIALESALPALKILANHYSALYTQETKELATLNTEYSTLVQSKKNVITAFEFKYRNYIREGTWSSDDYYDANQYYLDAVNTATNSSLPKVKYTINVIDVSGDDEFSSYQIHIGDKTYVEDTEIFGYVDSNKVTPYREKIAITGITFYLNDPSKTSITVSNYQSEFTDLFQTMSASVTSLESNQASYDRAANAITVQEGITYTYLQKAFENNKTIISKSKLNQSYVLDNNGLLMTDKDNGQNLVKLIDKGLFISSDGGDTWTAGITADGINSSIFTSGVLNTNKVVLMDGEYPTFRWDSTGINAFSYTKDSSGTITEMFHGKFIRLDQFGLYGYSGTESAEWFRPTSETDITNSKDVFFSLTWSGFRLKTHHTDYVMDESGNYQKVVGGGINITTENDFTVTDVNDTTRIKIGVIEEAQESGGLVNVAKYGIIFNDNSGNLVLRSTDVGDLWLSGKLYVGGRTQQAAKVILGVTGKYKSWNGATPVEATSDTDWTFSKVFETYSYASGVKTTTLGIYDDGTFMTPNFRIDSAGNVHLMSEDASFYGARYYADKKVADGYVLMESNGLALYREKTGEADLLSARLGFTDNQQSPYLWLGGYKVPATKAALFKTYPNGLWIGNEAPRDEDIYDESSGTSINFTPKEGDKGIFIEYEGSDPDAELDEGQPMGWIVEDTIKRRISTGNVKAVFA